MACFVSDCRSIGSTARYSAGLLFNATLMAGVGGILATPDLPQLLFWSFTLWALARLESSQQGRWWLVIGLGCGLTVLSKYTGVLLIVGIVVWLISCEKARLWWHHPQLFAGAALTLATTLPVPDQDWQHNFVSLIQQGGSLGDGGGMTWRYLVELLGSQAGLATPLVFTFCVVGTWGAWQAWRNLNDPAAALLCCLILPSTALFIWQATGSRVQGNWPSLLLPAACMAAAGYCPDWWQSWRKPAVVLGFTLVLPVYLQASLGLVPLPAELDVTLMRIGGWPEFAAAVDTQRIESRGIPHRRELRHSLPSRALNPRISSRDWPGPAVESFQPQFSDRAGQGTVCSPRTRGRSPFPPGLMPIGPEWSVIRARNGW